MFMLYCYELQKNILRYRKEKGKQKIKLNNKKKWKAIDKQIL